MAQRGSGQYCCVINCNNYQSSIIDNQKVRFHKFPVKNFQLCQRWLINIRRADLNLHTIKAKKVCSVHFENAAYACPSNAQNSSLLCTAVPTLVRVKNSSLKLAPTLKQCVRSISPESTLRHDLPNVNAEPTKPEHCRQPVAVNLPSVNATFANSRRKQSVDYSKLLRAEKYKRKLLDQKYHRLQSKVQKLETQINSMKDDQNTCIDKLMKRLPPMTQAFLQSQLQLKDARGMRWIEYPKVMELCLALFYRGQGAYAILRNFFTLPSPQTLRQQYSYVLGKCGSTRVGWNDIETSLSL